MALTRMMLTAMPTAALLSAAQVVQQRRHHHQQGACPRHAAKWAAVQSRGGARPAAARRCVVRVLNAGGSGQGGGVLDRPVTTPGRESEFDVGKETKRKKKIPPDYRVLLHNDNFNKREYVVQCLLKIIPAMTVDIAINIMKEAHSWGKAVVIQCPQDEAEEYCELLRLNGLISTVEPASGKGDKGDDD